MTDIPITPKNSTESWKKHIKWYILLFLEQLEKIKWDNPQYFHLDQIGWDVPVEDLDEDGWDAQVEDLAEIGRDSPDNDLDKIGLDVPVEDLDQIGLDTLVEDLEKDIQSEDTSFDETDSQDTDSKNNDSEDTASEKIDSKDSDSEGSDSEKANPKDSDPLSNYFDELKRIGPLLNHEQEFWLAMDIQAGLRMKQVISADGISEVYGDLIDNWNQYSAMTEALRLPSIDWDRAVSVIVQQRLSKECERFSELFPWLESMKDHPEVRQKISNHATRIYLDLIILPVTALLMIADRFANGKFALPGADEIDHWYKLGPTIEWPVNEIFSQADLAKERLILSNLRFVVHIAKKYYFSVVEFTDLIQQGNLGLILTTDGYDPSRGNKFSTYAAYRIRKEITHYIADNSHFTHLSEDDYKKKYHVYQTSERLYRQLQRLPTTNEIAETLGSTPVTEVLTLLEFDKKPKSLDEPLHESDDDVLEDIIEDPVLSDKLNDIELHPLDKDIEYILNTLPADQRKVIALRFGFDGQDRTLKEVGDTLGLPEDQIHTIEVAALNYLRHPARSKLLRKYLESIQK